MPIDFTKDVIIDSKTDMKQLKQYITDGYRVEYVMFKLLVFKTNYFFNKRILY